ncbi:putative ankyrin repeat protein [Cotonvirus japonicus]|uniref:Ankyrin repeat protein n=1 Tax=Cotonvirus japonicus TaxID=2811091 RepID=A0ABM7NU73_9VIRU|nr:putative ankyrin repeat protein [Cotonvirus japonicus]BCS83611.1 putative ankyrin repeat protein [Cotonvirus japonicus]
MNDTMLFQNYSIDKKYYCCPKTLCKNFSQISYLVSHLKILDIDVVLEYISNNRGKIDSQNEFGWTALMIACRNCTIEKDAKLIKLLLECGANVNIQNNDGKTALMLLVKYSENNLDVIKLLLDNGADVNIKENSGWTALMSISVFHDKLHYVDVIKLLLEYNAEINLQSKGGWTALMLASKYSATNTDIVKLLLDNNADINLKNKDGWTALTIVSLHINDKSNIGTLKLLLESGINVNHQTNIGMTSINIISKNSKNDNNIDAIKMLMNYGADPNIIGTDGNSSLSFLSINNNIETILLLLDYGVDFKLNLKSSNFFSNLNFDGVIKIIDRIKKIAITKNIFSCVCNDVKKYVKHLHLEPNSFSLKLISIHWHLNTGEIEKIITWENLNIFDYFGIYDIDSLNLKIIDAIKYMD